MSSVSSSDVRIPIPMGPGEASSSSVPPSSPLSLSSEVVSPLSSATRPFTPYTFKRYVMHSGLIVAIESYRVDGQDSRGNPIKILISSSSVLPTPAPLSVALQQSSVSSSLSLSSSIAPCSFSIEVPSPSPSIPLPISPPPLPLLLAPPSSPALDLRIPISMGLGGASSSRTPTISVGLLPPPLRSDVQISISPGAGGISSSFVSLVSAEIPAPAPPELRRTVIMPARVASIFDYELTTQNNNGDNVEVVIFQRATKENEQLEWSLSSNLIHWMVKNKFFRKTPYKPMVWSSDYKVSFIPAQKSGKPGKTAIIHQNQQRDESILIYSDSAVGLSPNHYWRFPISMLTDIATGILRFPMSEKNPKKYEVMTFASRFNVCKCRSYSMM